MADFDRANKLLNKSERMVDELAQEVASLSFSEKKESLRRLAEAMESLGKVKDTIIRHNPSLEYHLDSNRPPTEYMAQIHSRVKKAERFMETRDFESAISLLTQALDMEPPPIIHEAIMQKIDQAKSRM